MLPDLSWEPVLAGARYCAPACGRGCTKVEFNVATASAEQLARLMGGGWAACVWENLGWHYSVKSPCRRVAIHPSGAGFIAFLNGAGQPGGRWSAFGKTPQQAVDNVVNEARSEYEWIGEVLDGWEAA
jgi:hypothetical protein